MDRQDSNLPDHDPAASSFPAVHRDERVVAGIDRLAAGSRDLGARDALLRVRHALHLGVSTRDLLAVLDRLTGPGGTTAATLEGLDQLADQAGRR
jgi:hypothetical protein